MDCHNQACQNDLGLEETWVMTDCYFQLVTTLMGLSVTDAWKLADYHGIINFGKQEDHQRYSDWFSLFEVCSTVLSSFSSGQEQQIIPM